MVMAESRGTSLQSQMAVAQTILDRSTQRNQTAEEVITSPYQYATPYQGKIDDLSVFAVDLVYFYGYRVFEQLTTHFYAYEQVYPAWADVKTERGVIGGHRFMY